MSLIIPMTELPHAAMPEAAAVPLADDGLGRWRGARRIGRAVSRVTRAVARPVRSLPKLPMRAVKSIGKGALRVGQTVARTAAAAAVPVFTGPVRLLDATPPPVETPPAEPTPTMSEPMPMALPTPTAAAGGTTVLVSAPMPMPSSMPAMAAPPASYPAFPGAWGAPPSAAEYLVASDPPASPDGWTWEPDAGVPLPAGTDASFTNDPGGVLTYGAMPDIDAVAAADAAGAAVDASATYPDPDAHPPFPGFLHG
jgi:hypothetical protein